MLQKPNIEDKSQDEGSVVIKITVDKNGNVTYAENILKKSTTTNAGLIKKATDAAYKIKFSKDTKGYIQQTGTITFKFKLRGG